MDRAKNGLSSRTKKEVSIIHHNVQSIGNCVDAVQDLLNVHEDCIAFCMSEHWKTESQLKSYNILGYELASSHCRKAGAHGAVAVFIRKDVEWRVRNDIVNTSEDLVFECAAVEVRVNDFKTLILGVYRTPSTAVQDFLPKLERVLMRVFNENVPVLLLVILILTLETVVEVQLTFYLYLAHLTFILLF